MSDEYGWIFLGSEENMLDYPFGLFQVWLIGTVGPCWDYVVSNATMTGAAFCFGYFPTDVILSSLCIRECLLKKMRMCFSSCFCNAKFHYLLFGLLAKENFSRQ